MKTYTRLPELGPEATFIAYFDSAADHECTWSYKEGQRVWCELRDDGLREYELPCDICQRPACKVVMR